MNFRNLWTFLFICLCAIINLSCKKDKVPDTPFINKAGIKKIQYLVKGTNFRINYIDSNSVFKRDQVFRDSFRYEFAKGSGARIGISIGLQSTADSIFSWYIYIDGKLYANAYSEGGAYLDVPYN